jgi:uncharacterized protein (TIGR02466 family)
MSKHEWWSTPVWDVKSGFDSKFNNELSAEIATIHAGGGPFNLWEHRLPRIIELESYILKTVGDSIAEYLPKSMQNEPAIYRGWVNRNGPGSSLAIHNHGSALIACTYYISAPPDCGDLLLVDPRGGANWGWESEGNIIGIKHKRIKPTEGNLVFFPACLLHSVDVNRSRNFRVSVSSNVGISSTPKTNK